MILIVCNTKVMNIFLIRQSGIKNFDNLASEDTGISHSDRKVAKVESRYLRCWEFFCNFEESKQANYSSTSNNIDFWIIER